MHAHGVRHPIYFNNLVGRIYSGLRFSAPMCNEAMPLKLQTHELKCKENRIRNKGVFD